MKTLLLLALVGIAALLCFPGPQMSGDADDAEVQLVRRSEHAMGLFARGHMGEAEMAFAGLCEEFALRLGPRAPATLGCLNNFAASLQANGDFAHAESANRLALTLREEESGRLHPDALASRHNLAVTLLSEGKFDEALLNERCVESAWSHMLGRNHPQSREARRLRMMIEESLEGSRRGDDTPRGGPSGLGDSTTGLS
ncbi:MAG: tetratricopeptide repeat protein [Chthoniobacteraceae bacterium]